MKKNPFFLKFKKVFLLILTLVFVNAYNSNLFASINKIDEEKNFIIQNNVYLIGPGDILRLNVFDVQELSSDLEVLPDGTIFLPLAGSLYVKDLSIDKVKNLIQLKLSEHLLVPEVQLTLVGLKPIRVSLIGELQKPGIYLFDNKGKDNTRITTLVDALKSAGGLTGKSDIKKIRVVRKYLDNEKLELKEAYFNLWELINNGDQNNNPVLFDGDSIFINKAKETSEERSEFAFANLTPDTMNVRIIGSVIQPGEIKLPINTPLSQAIYSTGGPTNFTSQNKAYIIRLNRNGTVTNNKYKISNKLSTSDKYNPPLRNNDIVYVPPNNFSRATSALSTVASPLTNVVTILSFLKLVESY